MFGSNYEKQFIDMGDIKIVIYFGVFEILVDLVVGCIDVVYNDCLVVNYIINDQKLLVCGVGQIGDVVLVGIVLKKGNLVFKDQIDKVLIEMCSDGIFEKISQKWFGQDVGQF